jgi:hypothetical protein
VVSTAARDDAEGKASVSLFFREWRTKDENWMIIA